MCLAAVRFVLTGTLAVGVFVNAPVIAAGEGKSPPGPHEKTGDPYLAPSVPLVVRMPPVVLPARSNPFAPVQANVNALGENIPNDAANEPSIAVDPSAPNRMVIGWRQFDNIGSNFRQAGWGYSTDGGRTWTFPGVIEPGVFRSDPVLDFDAYGNFYYNSLKVVGSSYTCDVFISVDGGVTWSNGTDAYGGDKQWMTIDRTAGMGEGHIYCGWTDYFSSCDGSFTRSTDGGQTFVGCLSVPNDPMWVTLAVDPEGELYEAGLDWWADQFVITRSSNAQNAGQTPTFNLSRTVNLGGSATSSTGPNPGGLLGQVWVACDHSVGPHRGNVYMLSSVNPPGGDPLDVMFARSTDGGSTWSNPVRVNDVATGWQWFGTMSVAPNGRIDVIWNDTRNDPGGYDSELFYSSSTDAGETWSANLALTPPWDPHIGWPNQDKIGDYYDMISDRVGAHVAISTTFNGEQDVYYLRIGDYDCNDNGIGDSEDIDDGTSNDCNANEIPDECEIAADPSLDADGSGILDECEARGDIDGDGDVDTADLLALLANWGDCPEPPEPCPGDLDGDGDVDTADLLALLGNWGRSDS